MWKKLIGQIIGPLFGVIDKAVTDKDLALQLKNQIENALINLDAESIKAATSIIVAEAQGASWMQRNWRPITMLTFVFIIANNYILVPYAVSFGLPVPMLEIPPGMWGLLTVGIGGYIGGRSYEKVQAMQLASREGEQS